MKMKFFRVLSDGTLYFKCPGCQSYQGFNRTWTITGEEGDTPTVAPSLLTRWTKNFGTDEAPDIKEQICHLFIQNGQLVFLSDCTHELAGKTVPMVELTEDD